MTVIEMKRAKEFADGLFGDPVLKMATLAVLNRMPKLELVQCKDCSKNGNDEECPLLSIMQYTEPDNYCSCGERKIKHE